MATEFTKLSQLGSVLMIDLVEILLEFPKEEHVNEI